MIDKFLRVLIIVVVLSFVGKVFAENAGQATQGALNVANSVKAIRDTSIKQLQAGGESAEAAKTLKKACSGWNSVACVAAALASAQGVAMIVSALKNSNSADEYTCKSAVCQGYENENPGFENGFSNDNYGLNGDASFRLSNQNLNQAKKLLQDLENNLEELNDLGYSFDPTSNMVNTPKGRVSTATLSSPQSMAQAGFTPSEIKQLQKTMDEIKKNNLKKTLAHYGFDEKNLFESNGKNQKSHTTNVNSEDVDLNEFMKRFQKGLNGSQRGVAGLQKMYGNQPVGVAGDNLFEMINRRYQSESRKGAFLVDKVK